jgi:hypothetical protein
LSSQNPILGLSETTYSELNLEIEAVDAQWAVASVMSFMQAFYPPHLLSPSSGDVVDQDFIMANGTYDNYPMGGYQYPMIEVRSQYDPDSIWLDAYDNCATAEAVQNMYYQSKDANNTLLDTLPYYRSLGYDFLQDRSTVENWSYDSAWSMFDTLDYLSRHNSTVAQALAANGPLQGILPLFAELAARKQWDLYGNMSASGETPGDEILVVGGKTLAAKMLALLQDNVVSQGVLQKFSLLVGDYEAMIALLSLLGLGDYNSGLFHILPPYGSAMVFEAFTYDHPDNASIIPDPNNLWVRFLFRNASDPSSSDAEAAMPPIYAYPIFDRGPSGTDMPWNDFVAAMNAIALNDVPDYCVLCQAPTLYCSPYLSDNQNSKTSRSLTTPVAGVIGAVVTLSVLGLAIAAAVVFAGLRFHRRPRERSQLGGFKGSAKLASDADIRLPKNAAALGIAAVDNESKKGHERVGSWELNDAKKEEGGGNAGFYGGHQRFASLGSTVVGRSSFEADDDDLEGIHSTPTTPRENL